MSNGYPKDWQAFNRVHGEVDPREFGFKSSTGDINRFSARFRAAKLFDEIKFDGFSKETTSGYSSLCKVVFSWSAFETYLNVLGLEQKDCIASIAGFKVSSQVVSSIKKIDRNDIFYKFIYERVNRSHQKELESYFQEGEFNITYLASSIRHIFAHGWLTPNADKVDPQVSSEICKLISDFLIETIDQDFSRRIIFTLKNYR